MRKAMPSGREVGGYGRAFSVSGRRPEALRRIVFAGVAYFRLIGGRVGIRIW